MQYIAAGVIIMLLGGILLQYFELKKFTLTTYTLPVDSMESSGEISCIGRFVFLSDLHNHEYGKQNEQLLTAIDEIKPDFIIIGGDMLNAKPGAPLGKAVSFVQRLAEKYPVYYGNGNHEYRLRLYPEKYGDMYWKYKSELDRAGVHHLENRTEIIYLKNKKINICGLEIDRKYYRRFEKACMQQDYVESELGKRPSGYSILIAHNPEYFSQYAAWGADLTLSGHVHGGMIRLPKVGGVISPRLRLFPKYSGGIYKNSGKRMIVSRGLGMHTIPIRIGNRAELIVVNLEG